MLTLGYSTLSAASSFASVGSIVVFAVGVAVGLAVGVFDDDVQPHVPTTSAATMVTNIDNFSGFVFLPP